MNKAQELFQLHANTVDYKVEIAVGHSIDKVLDKIEEIRGEMRSEFSRLETRIGGLETRMAAVETKLGLVNEAQKELRSRALDYLFKSIWVTLGVLIAFILMHVTILFH